MPGAASGSSPSARAASLFRSCSTPPAKVPRASIFSARRKRFSILLCSSSVTRGAVSPQILSNRLFQALRTQDNPACEATTGSSRPVPELAPMAIAFFIALPLMGKFSGACWSTAESIYQLPLNFAAIACDSIRFIKLVSNKIYRSVSSRCGICELFSKITLSEPRMPR